MTSDALIAHLKTLDGVKLGEGADYETIGKMVIAAALRENEKNIRSSKPDAEGHIRLEGTLKYIVKLHAEREVCCWCSYSRDGTTEVCIGWCCP